jgi:anti-sigma regulatory factor (Ser/Thr protein kinase)
MKPSRWSRAFPETKASVAAARRFVTDALREVVPEASETAALLVSELATNALVHAGSQFEVTVVYPTPAGRVRIEVTDQDRSRPSPIDPPTTSPHGRGLVLVSTLADEWGVREARRRGGKAIWFELRPTGAAVGTATASSRARLSGGRVRRLGGARRARRGPTLFFGGRRGPGASLVV